MTELAKADLKELVAELRKREGNIIIEMDADTVEVYEAGNCFWNDEDGIEHICDGWPRSGDCRRSPDDCPMREEFWEDDKKWQT